MTSPLTPNKEPSPPEVQASFSTSILSSVQQVVTKAKESILTLFRMRNYDQAALDLAARAEALVRQSEERNKQYPPFDPEPLFQQIKGDDLREKTKAAFLSLAPAYKNERSFHSLSSLLNSNSSRNSVVEALGKVKGDNRQEDVLYLADAFTTSISNGKEKSHILLALNELDKKSLAFLKDHLGLLLIPLKTVKSGMVIGNFLKILTLLRMEERKTSFEAVLTLMQSVGNTSQITLVELLKALPQEDRSVQNLVAAMVYNRTFTQSQEEAQNIIERVPEEKRGSFLFGAAAYIAEHPSTPPQEILMYLSEQLASILTPPLHHIEVQDNRYTSERSTQLSSTSPIVHPRVPNLEEALLENRSKRVLPLQPDNRGVSISTAKLASERTLSGQMTLAKLTNFLGNLDPLAEVNTTYRNIGRKLREVDLSSFGLTEAPFYHDFLFIQNPAIQGTLALRSYPASQPIPDEVAHKFAVVKYLCSLSDTPEEGAILSPKEEFFLRWMHATLYEGSHGLEILYREIIEREEATFNPFLRREGPSPLLHHMVEGLLLRELGNPDFVDETVGRLNPMHYGTTSAPRLNDVKEQIQQLEKSTEKHTKKSTRLDELEAEFAQTPDPFLNEAVFLSCCLGSRLGLRCAQVFDPRSISPEAVEPRPPLMSLLESEATAKEATAILGRYFTPKLIIEKFSKILTDLLKTRDQQVKTLKQCEREFNVYTQKYIESGGSRAQELGEAQRELKDLDASDYRRDSRQRDIDYLKRCAAQELEQGADPEMRELRDALREAKQNLAQTDRELQDYGCVDFPPRDSTDYKAALTGRTVDIRSNLDQLGPLMISGQLEPNDLTSRFRAATKKLADYQAEAAQKVKELATSILFRSGYFVK